jgi:uncharacterized surface protein with fasciclin (FAS1) repeats
MKKTILQKLSVLSMMIFLLVACGKSGSEATSDSVPASTPVTNTGGGQSTVQDDISAKDIVKVAAGSPDHTTLVKAIQAADLVNALSNAGPFTVFAPTNKAFDKLPAGTVEDLLKPEKLNDLQNILQYHVTVSTYTTDRMKDGQVLGMVNGDNATITVKDGKYMINGSPIIASVQASNGIIHIIDDVLLPPAKK